MRMVFSFKLSKQEVATLRDSQLPKLVVVARQDKIMRPPHQRRAAASLHAQSLELNTGHMVATCSQAVADAVLKLAQGEQLK